MNILGLEIQCRIFCAFLNFIFAIYFQNLSLYEALCVVQYGTALLK